MKLRLLTLLTCISFIGWSQVEDSTRIKVENANSAEERVRILISDGWNLLQIDPLQTLDYANEAANDTLKITSPYLKDSVFRLTAFCYGDMNNRTKALENHLNRIRVLSTVDTLSKPLASAYYETAHVFLSQGNDELAYPYFLRCKEIAHQIKYDTQEGQVSIDLGDLAYKQGNYEEAIGFYQVGVDVFEAYERFGFVVGYAEAKIAVVYNEMGKKKLAFQVINKALEKIDTSMTLYVDYPGGIYKMAGQIYLKNDDFNQAIHYLSLAQNLFERYNKFYTLPEIYYDLSQAYKEVNVDSAFVFLDWYVMLNDSVINDENNKRMAELRFEFEEEQREQEILLLEQEKQIINQGKELAEAESAEKSQSIRLVILILLIVVLLLVLAVFMFRNSRIQNRLVNEQKRIVEERNKEIEDSIVYATRIQRAVIPEEQRLKALFPQSFVFYAPKDVLSGDFYWVYEVITNDGVPLNLFGVGDCTGHGVPGALLSILGINYLNLGAVNTNVNSPAQAMDLLNEGVMNTFGHSTETIRDGMDLVVGAVDPATNSLYYACAKNPIYVIRKGEIITLKGDKKAIGNDAYEDTFKFADHEFKLEEDDMIYALSDGYQDQFGGDEGRKFKVKKLKDLMVELSSLSIEEQEEKVIQIFNDWKGDYEQIDDVTFLGIRYSKTI